MNDGTGDGVWAFNQAYFYAAIRLLGQALTRLGHERAAECLELAESFRQAIEDGFGAACMASPAVQLRDHSWVPYVPCEVLSPHRLLQQWYPTDVDTGAAHLLRLGALAPTGQLADWLLNDHEDNLYLHAWGMANEPVYNQQATAYLLRDDPKAVIRAFYSMMACAFSHSTFEPVEHRWTWGQYFGPPSTDGAWFELYRNMLIQEAENDTLCLLAATPRQWLSAGQEISVRRAPTYYGEISFQAQGGQHRIQLAITMPKRLRPKTLLVRLRHAQNARPEGVTLNGQEWRDWNAAEETIRIPNPAEARYLIESRY